MKNRAWTHRPSVLRRQDCHGREVVDCCFVPFESSGGRECQTTNTERVGCLYFQDVHWNLRVAYSYRHSTILSQVRQSSGTGVPFVRLLRKPKKWSHLTSLLAFSWGRFGCTGEDGFSFPSVSGKLMSYTSVKQWGHALYVWTCPSVETLATIGFWYVLPHPSQVNTSCSIWWGRSSSFHEPTLVCTVVTASICTVNLNI